MSREHYVFFLVLWDLYYGHLYTYQYLLYCTIFKKQVINIFFIIFLIIFMWVLHLVGSRIFFFFFLPLIVKLWILGFSFLYSGKLFFLKLNHDIEWLHVFMCQLWLTGSNPTLFKKICVQILYSGSGFAEWRNLESDRILELERTLGHYNPVSLFYRWVNGKSENLSDLFKLSQLVSTRTGTGSHVSWFLFWCFVGG